VSDASKRQAAQYDRILSDYDRHYYDRFSIQYRDRFIFDPLLKGVDLTGKRVADIASGSGSTSLSLMDRFSGIEITGFDISAEACRRYRVAVKRDCYQLDLTRGYYDGQTFDAAIVMGGLHHCISNLAGALSSIASMLRPGGLLLMFEPNSDYVLQFARQLWYRIDSYFDAPTEAALSHDALLAEANGAFNVQQVTYFGGPAFYLVYNSLVFRLPYPVKAAVSSPLLSLEAAFNKLPGRWLFSSFLARWVRQG
jgi:SAM-dependent methyltransferase